ncbi:MAG: thiamine-binding protein [Caldisericia bacterium]|nr:thiamine-binding protein [Caldisericia bacterium]
MPNCKSNTEKTNIIQCCISLYPLGLEDYGSMINSCISKTDFSEVEVTYGNMNTQIKGERECVFSIVKKLYEVASNIHDNVIMNVAYSNCCP